MSGGSFDYGYAKVEENYCGCMHDIELNLMMKDLVELLRDLEWYESGDIGIGDYESSALKFKQKWLKYRV